MTTARSFIYRYENIPLEKLAVLTWPKRIIAEISSEREFARINDFASKVFNLKPERIEALLASGLNDLSLTDAFYFVPDTTFEKILNNFDDRFTPIDQYSIVCGLLEPKFLLHNDVLDYYNNYYPAFIEKWSNEEDHRLSFIGSDNLSEKCILDVGCGNGKLTKGLTDNNKIFGVDISNKLVQLAIGSGLTAFTLNLETEQLPFSDDYFDLVIGFDIFEHLFDYNQLLDEIYRCIKTNGTLLISIPVGENRRHKIMSLFFEQNKNQSDKYDGVIPDVNIRNFSDTISVFEKHGFITEYIEGWEWPWKPTYEYRKNYLKSNPEDADDIFVKLRKI